MSTLSRRTFLAGTGVGVATVMTGLGTTLLTSASFAQSDRNDRLVLVFLNGGADGLTIAPPYGLDSYRKLRPTLAVPAPGETHGALELTAASSNGNAVFPTGIEGTIGLHPSFKPLHDTLWKQGRLAVLPMMGIPNLSRSHFSAEKWFHHGGPANVRRGGWLGRAVEAKDVDSKYTSTYNPNADPMVSGSPASVGVVNSLDRFALTRFNDNPTALNALTQLYAGTDRVQQSGSRVIQGIKDIAGVDARLRSGYPRNKTGQALSEVATLFSAFDGIRIAALRFGGWDHHSGMGAGTDPNGRMAVMLSQLATSLRAFSDDTNGLENITVMVVTEFGRTINENGSGGTDHGQAGTYLAMGSGVKGGVFGHDYPDQLVLQEPERGDSPVLTDFRSAAWELMDRRFGVEPSAVFPDFDGSRQLGLAR